MNTLTNDLHSIIPSHCHERPFVCDGRPESCTVMVVGENPATEMGADWWSWWNDETGFDLAAFERDYKARRRAKGKTQLLSVTRRRLGILRDHGLKCLETNAFAHEKPDGHGAGPSNAELLRLFISRLPELRAIIVHGQEAQRLMAGIEVPARLRQWSLPHFASRRGMSDARIADLAAEVRKSVMVKP